MHQVAVFLADGFEEIEAVTVIDILRRGGLEVKTLALKETLVKGAHGIALQADALLDDQQNLDWELIVLPGGQPGSNTLRDDPRVGSLLERQLSRDKWIGAICAAPIALGAHGLLKGRHATCYPGFEQELKGAILSQESVVVDKKLVTSRGPGTAMSFALELLAAVHGKAQSDRVQKALLAGAKI
ncbi:MAG: DJ-1/PfpI family protein [Proteobacteria bacterium]|nr:DJ-1/PfpI family protein [Pseudomonadota bacterium]